MPHDNTSHPETPEERRRRLAREKREREANQNLPPIQGPEPNQSFPTPTAPSGAGSVLPKTIEIIRDEEGNQTGVRLPSGETFLGLSKEEIEGFARKEQERLTLPVGTQEAGTTLAQSEEELAIQEAIGRIGTIGGLISGTEADINRSQALTAGIIGSAPLAIGTGITAGTIGFAAGGPVGAAIGFSGAVAASIISGILGNIKEQQRGELATSNIVLTNSRSAMRQNAMLASRDPANADFYIDQYNAALTNLHQERRKVKAETSGDLNAWMEDGRADLARFDDFTKVGGLADIYGQKLQVALDTGQPLSIQGDQLFLPEEL